jgi:NRPS condensation-like uncharacterized protein
MERPLGALEHSFWLYDQIHPVHFAIAAKIRGVFSPTQLQNALDQVQQQHPLLRVRIATDGKNQPKFIEENIPIPIRLASRIDHQQWQRELETEMSQSFDWSKAPLVRVVLLQSELISDLIVVYHHSIADGISGAYLLGDIVQGLVQEDFQRQELATALSIEQAYALSSNISEESQIDYQTTVSSRTSPCIRTSLLSAESTQQLVERCRREDTTIHGAVSAAFLFSLAKQKNANPLRCLSPINVRSHLSLPQENAVGMYISYGVTTHDLQWDSAFWEVARSVKSQLSQLDLTQQLSTELSLRQSVLATQPTAQMVVDGMQQQYGYHLLVTNLGRLDLPQQFGALRIEELYGPAVMAGVDQEKIVGVATLGDRLSLTILIPSEVDETTTDWVATNFMADGLQLLERSVALALI